MKTVTIASPSSRSSRRLPLLAAATAALGILAAASLCAQGDFRELGAPPPADKPAKIIRATARPEKAKTTERISFSDKTTPGTLKINVAVAQVGIEGTNGDEVVVTTTLDKKGAAKVDDDGFRRLDQQEATFELVENGNIVTLRVAGGLALPWLSAGAEFKIKVPRNTNLIIKTQLGDDIEIQNIGGDIEVSTMNGGISLENVSGSVIANTVGGKIDAEFKRPPQKPVSLTTMNGGIELSLPAQTAANLRMRTMNGAIRTNFPEDALKITTTAAAPVAAKRQMSMQVTSTGDGNMAFVASGNGDDGTYAYATTTAGIPVPPLPPVPPTDAELAATIIETRKAQALEYADKGLAAAQKGMAAAVKAIDEIKGLSDEEKELIKRKLQSGASVIPRTVRASMPSVGGKTIAGELNGGGVDIQLTTMNGPITLKQEK